MTTPLVAGGFSTPLHVVLVEPEIHWNTGNVGRTCLAAGAQLHLVEPLGFSLADARVRRAGLDYWDRVRPRVWPSLPVAEAEIPQVGEPLLFTSEGDIDYWDVRYPRPVTLWFGSESLGLPRPLLDRFPGRRVRIPMAPDSVRSLNLSTAVALVLYEALRQSRQIG